MKRGTLIGLIVAGVLVLGVGGAVAVTALGGAAPEAVATETPSPAPVETTEPAEDAEADAADDAAAGESEPAVSPGAYVEYSEAALADAEGTRVLFFHATWCPQCHSLDSSIKSNGVPDGVTILKVDYDTNQDLRQQYGVTQQTTVVQLDENGDKVALHVPYSSPTVANALDGLGLS